MPFKLIKKSLIIALIFAPVTLGFAIPTVAILSDSSSISGTANAVATADTRDVNLTPMTPVVYEYEGIRHQELIFGQYLTGETATVTVATDGTYVHQISVPAAAIIIGALTLLGAGASFLIHAILITFGNRFMEDNDLEDFLVPQSLRY
jgi:hypothetical protein